MARTSSTGNPEEGSSRLEKTLGSTQKVADQVQQASEDLAVIHTVLEQEVPKDVQVGEVAQAIEHTEQLERKLAGSVKTLQEANQALAKEVKRAREAGSEGA